MKYRTPLPRTLVVAAKTDTGIFWHDYTQRRQFNQYSHSLRCACH
jgi:hypothetical protein